MKQHLVEGTIAESTTSDYELDYIEEPKLRLKSLS